MTPEKQNNSTASTRSQSCCVGPGSGRCSRPNPSVIAKYAPAKKIPAFTRPRSTGSTAARKNERTTSSATAIAGSGQEAVHSCAR